MPATGSNNSNKEKVLSIRLASDGLSFSVVFPSGEGTGDNHIAFDKGKSSRADALEHIIGSRKEFADDFLSVQIFLDTTDTAYVPAEVVGSNADSGANEAWLREVGISPSKAEEVVVSPTVRGLRAVMVFDSKSINFLRAKFGQKAVFFSPLQENMEMKERLDLKDGGCIVNLTGTGFYITLFNAEGQLSIAEAYPYKTDADIVYYLHALSGGAGLQSAGAKMRIYLYGSRAAENIKVIRRYFKRAVCV